MHAGQEILDEHITLAPGYVIIYDCNLSKWVKFKQKENRNESSNRYIQIIIGYINKCPFLVAINTN